MLYLVATPIGNIKDFSLRAIETLKNCDYILCEDTRHSLFLLNEYAIKKPLKSFHLFNEKKREEEVILDLKAGKNISVISDAGTPGICDPGESLVKRCREEAIAVTAIPGPCAWTLALALCSFSKERVQFLGFLPKQISLFQKKLTDICLYSGTSIFYESPHRILETLSLIANIEPLRKMCILRELTKKFEEHLEKTALDFVDYFSKHPPKGEFVILIEGKKQDYSTLSIQEHVLLLQKNYALSLSDAIKVCAELREVPKREIYHQFHRDP